MTHILSNTTSQHCSRELVKRMRPKGSRSDKSDEGALTTCSGPQGSTPGCVWPPNPGSFLCSEPNGAGWKFLLGRRGWAMLTGERALAWPNRADFLKQRISPRMLIRTIIKCALFLIRSYLQVRVAPTFFTPQASLSSSSCVKDIYTSRKASLKKFFSEFFCKLKKWNSLYLIYTIPLILHSVPVRLSPQHSESSCQNHQCSLP